MSFFGTYLKKCGYYLGLTIKYGSIWHCSTNYLSDIVYCYGSSMEPTIRSHDIVLCEHVTQYFRPLEIGDIVIARSVSDPRVNICKRIAGVAGQTVWDGRKLVMIPRGQVWLQGDNVDDSSDSRHFGPVPEGLVHGKVTFRVWPLKDARIFHI